MTPHFIDRPALKAQVRQLLHTAQVPYRSMTMLYLAILVVLDLVQYTTGQHGVLSIFISILTSLLGLVLGAGFLLYCMAIRRGERAEYLTLFDGFSFVGKIIGSYLLQFLLITLWSMLFVIPGIIAIRRGERAEYLTLFDGFSFVGKIIGSYLLQFLLITLWSMLFVIPGIIAAYRYRFALYDLYEDPSISILEALSRSSRQTRGYKGQLFLLDMSYIGWMLLASLPSLLHTFLIYGQPATTASPLMPGWTWLLVESLWMLLVSPLYLAHYNCVDLGYFEAAKSTAGTSAPTPDGLGGI